MKVLHLVTAPPGWYAIYGNREEGRLDAVAPIPFFVCIDDEEKGIQFRPYDVECMPGCEDFADSTDNYLGLIYSPNERPSCVHCLDRKDVTMGVCLGKDL